MRRLRLPPRLIAFAAVALAGTLLLGFASWPDQPYRIGGLGGLMVAALLTSLLSPTGSGTENSVSMMLSFVIDFSALLLFGPLPMSLFAFVGAVARGLADSDTSYPVHMINVAAAVLATQAAGLAFAGLDGTMGRFEWPWMALPISAAVVAYCVVKTGSADLVAPLVMGGAIDENWPKQALRRGQSYVIAAGLAVVFVEVIDHRAWGIFAVASVPLYFMFKAYGTYLVRIDRDLRRRIEIESLEHGASILDARGRVTLWNRSLARMVNCPADRAAGGLLVDAVPSLAQTELPRAVADALKETNARTFLRRDLVVVIGARTLNVTILPDIEGTMLLWHDVTQQATAEDALKRSAERFALAAEGANDGLWEWDLRTHELYVSPRWRTMIGLPESKSHLRREDWFDRVHHEDLTSLKEALHAHLSEQSDHFQHEHRIRHEDGTYRTFLCRGVAVRTPGRRPTRIAGSLTDVTERSVTQEQLRSAGFRDPLTSLSNRTVFVERLGQRLNEFKEHRGGRFAVLYLDLDRFKVVNDSLGHLVGDELLMGVSRRLESCLRTGDALARLGGDEFAILLHGLGDEIQANAIAFRIQDSLSAPFIIGGREVVTSASIGIAFSLPDYTNPEEIMRDADTAMYHAKERGRARHELFDADMHARALDRLGLETDLRHAIKTNALEVHYQPIVFLATGMCAGFEALVRWKRNGKPVSPAQFIPIAEELGLIELLGARVLEEACNTFAEWQRRFPAAELECITVNVSARQLAQQGFVNVVEQAVQEARLKPADLRLEITETALMHGPHQAAAVLHDLRQFGVKIYLDDFGTGYSSLSHLHRLPVDALKIDRSFVKSLLLDDRPAIVESILALARTLHTSVVAEGVESALQARELERLGCRHAQGFFFAPALPPRSVEELLIARQPLGGKRTQPSEPAAAPRRESEQPAIAGRVDWPAQLPARVVVQS